MHGHERHDESALRAHGDDHRRHQRRYHDVIRRGRQTHAENQAHQRDQQQHHDQAAARQELDEFTDYLVRAGQGNRADDDAGRTGRNRDADHVTGTCDHALDPVANADPEGVLIVTGAAEKSFQRILGQNHDNHRNRGPERG